MLLIIEALLLILAALGQDHRAAVDGQIFPLDIALNSVDDNYDGCTKEMANLVKTKYLSYKNTWIRYRGPLFTPRSHVRDVLLQRLEKRYTRNGKTHYTVMTYKWYSLYFLLTDEIQILKKQQNKCYKTYRGTNVTFNGRAFTSIRFGSFTSSSVSAGRAYSFGNVSCFEIYTCEGADISKYSRVPYEGEVLIPPYETFNVNLRCQTVFELNSTGIKSDLNCALFKKPPKTKKFMFCPLLN
ncbi:NAD(P)(+)--arginine ADP-ribosyltransferase 2-like [Cyprinus carpio]|uniref:NAD(P)(+)--arginine ADP-ribosyltransferase n=1 Tax=Cyprinus carpio TaxID=7962 RepID=A0A9Q9VUX1_CYPCA|nr:NAD(P)(+)--arginine ADP-ribosyltransferase 2-like [Cyprinus carpio]